MSRATATSSPDLIAGLVLGSNSFHLLIARRDGDRLVPEGHLQEAVQLAAGVGADGAIEPAYLERARSCLERFATELVNVRPALAGAVATGVLRRAANAGELLRTAAGALGMPVHVLSGQDEAVLTYAGVVLTSGASDDNLLVVDIGGGSTELVIGRRYAVLARESVDVGCIPVTRRFFPEPPLSIEAFEAAGETVRRELQVVRGSLAGTGWARVVGTGGTILAAGGIMQVRRMCGSTISRRSLERLESAMIDQPLDELGRNIATPERLAVLPGGVVVLRAIFDELGIDRMKMSPGALREGVLVMLAQGRLPGTRAAQPD